MPFGLCTKVQNEAEPVKVYELLEGETNQWALYHEGTQLLNIYSVDKSTWSQPHYNNLTQKCHEILKLNPWLMGSLKQPEKLVHLALYENKLVPENFVSEELINPDIFKNEMTYTKKCELLRKFQTKKAYEILADDNEQLAHFWLLRDTENVEQANKIAIIFSINHIIADGGTLYNLFNMLDSKTLPRALDRQSINPKTFLKEQAEFTKLLKADGKDFLEDFDGISFMAPFFMKSISRMMNKQKYKPKIWNFKVNNDEINRIKSIYNNQVLRQFVSTNDILTSWLFCKNPKANFIQSAVDLRGRLPSVGHDKAGNYLTLMLLDNKDIQSPLKLRELIKHRLSAQDKSNPSHATFPGYKTIKTYIGGVSSNWTRFYKSVGLEGLTLDMSTPFADEAALIFRMAGIDLAMEDNVIVFKCNDNETAVYIMSGSGKITDEDLLSDPMLAERLF